MRDISGIVITIPATLCSEPQNRSRAAGMKTEARSIRGKETSLQTTAAPPARTAAFCTETPPGADNADGSAEWRKEKSHGPTGEVGGIRTHPRHTGAARIAARETAPASDALPETDARLSATPSTTDVLGKHLGPTLNPKGWVQEF